MKKTVLTMVLAMMLFIWGCIPINDSVIEWEDPYAPIEPDFPSTSDQLDIPSTPNEPDKPEQPDEPQQPEEPENTIIKIVAAGDNLLHNTISFDAAQNDGSYDFSGIYTRIKHITSNAQIGFINQEIMLTGNVNIINLASNHTLDKGEEGLEACLKNVKKRGFDAILGAYETEEESKIYNIVEKDGVTFGFLSYTYGMNLGKLSKGNEWKVDLIDESKIVKDMKALRPLCDYLIVSMHWGAEYVYTPTPYQRKIGQLLCDYGADLIIGTHPHVLQPLETLTSANGKYKTICAWSLGNFISNQHRLDTMLGGILQVKLVYDKDKNLIETQTSIIPTVTHYNDKSRGYEIYLLEDYTEELASQHGIKNYAESPLTLQFLQDLAKQVVGENIADEVY